MSWSKKYAHLTPFKLVICIDTQGCLLLKNGIRGVIKQTPTKYLIQFMSGSAHWYSKSRFIDIPVKKEVSPVNQLF